MGGTSRDVLVKGVRVLARAAREEPAIFATAVGGAVVNGLFTIGAAYLIGPVVARIVVPALAGHQIHRGALALAAAALVAFSVVKVVGIVCRRLGAGSMQYRLQATYRRRIIRRYLALPMLWHRRHATGTLLANASSDAEAAWAAVVPLPFAVGTVVMLLAAIVSLFVTDWAVGLVGLGLVPTLSGVYVVYSRRMAPRAARAQQLRGEVSAIAHESFDGAVVVKAMGREAYETARFAVKVGELRDVQISIGRIRGALEPLMDALPSIGTLTALLVGAWRLRQGAIGVGELVSVAFLFALLDFPVRAIGWLLTELPRSVAGWDRVHAVLTASGQMAYGDAVLGGGTPVEIRFDRVTFGYQPDQPVLREASFMVPAGRTVALVGPTGVGKSTIAALAARLLDADAGTVTIDGVDVRRLSAASLAATVALVPQVPFVFADTARANVTLDRPDVDDDRLWSALRTARADEFVAGLPDGLRTALGERGVLLSGGQRQRLTVARALAGRPRLLILDDATSAVDPRVEAAIFDRLAGDGGPPASILVIAHRSATIARADAVVYLADGRVVATGTHDELLAAVPGYADLVTAYERAEARAPVEEVAV